MIRRLAVAMLLYFLVNPITSHSQSREKNFATTEYYTNPVYNLNFPDPTIIRGHDGLFYAYATQTSENKLIINIQVALSHDMVNWKFMGDALPKKPTWADTTQSFWAPHVLYDSANQNYYMYYSAESNEIETGKCIGVAISKNPLGPFVDSGKPLIVGKGFVNIDPMAFDDPLTKKKLLYWGSGFQPIKVCELSDDRLTLKPGANPVDVVSPGKDADYNILIEGAWMRYREGKYFLFYSGDNCCGDKANYAVMVARSNSALGPFTRLGETAPTQSSAILVLSNEWIAPGHNSIIEDAAGNDWIFYHAISKTDPFIIQNKKKEENDKRVMLLDRIYYKDGWPYILNRVPSSAKTKAPAVK